MREYATLWCVVGVVACHGDGKSSSVAQDTATVAGPPAVGAAPARADSMASRSRTTSTSGAATGESKPPATASGTTRGGSVTRGGAKTTGTTFVPPAPLVVIDSVRGIVSVVGTDRDRRVMIARTDGGRRVQVTGPLARLIGHVAGADVSVVGTSSGTSLEATQFLVKTVDGAPAIDGTLKTEGPALYIVTTDGNRTRIIAPPPPLQGHDGARVWITGDPSRGVASFGFIDPPG
jgi:hypothetical protein